MKTAIESGTEEYRTFLQQFINKITVFPYELEIELNVGLRITDDLKETITIRRGELYGMFESRVSEKESLREVKADTLQEGLMQKFRLIFRFSCGRLWIICLN